MRRPATSARRRVHMLRRDMLLRLRMLHYIMLWLTHRVLLRGHPARLGRWSLLWGSTLLRTSLRTV